LENNSNFSKLLLNWYQKKNFQFPWRDTNDPYKIWISEIMLQQTQVSTVINYYNKWIEEYPTINQLSKSSIDDLLKMWEGLGYYQRVHNIHETSCYIAKYFNGKIPNTYNELIKCKGIGDYTASAILSIAFSKKYPSIDGNIKRIMSRVNLIKGTKKIDKISKDYLYHSMNNVNPGDINQAMMDVGREICKPSNPDCIRCPINIYCQAYLTNQINLYPVKKIKKIIPSYNVVVGIIWHKNKFLISKRKSTGHLAGLWELPGGKKEEKENSINCLNREIYEELNIKVRVDGKIGTIKHKYSHFNINMTAYNCYYDSKEIKSFEAQEIKWITSNVINKIAFPKATLKIFQLNNL